MRTMPVFWKLIVIGIILILVAFLYYPIAFMFQKAFFPVKGFSLEFFGLLFSNTVLLQAIATSTIMGITVMVLCVVVSLPLAWFSTRYRLPWQGALNGLMMLPMILPPFVGAIGMKLFLSRFGTLNIILMNAGIIDSPIDWMGSGYWGVVILQVLHLFPIVYLNLSAALANIDPSLEEAAWNLGSGNSSFIRKILLPLTLPGLFAGCTIVFIWSVTDLGTPLILDYRNVIAYQIYGMITDINENPMGYALVIFVLTWIGLVYFASKKLFLRGQTHMSSKAVRSTSKARASTGVAILGISCFMILGAISVVPHLMVILSSIAEKWFMTALPEKMSLTYYATALEHPLTVLSVRNSLFLSSITTMVNIVVGLLGAYVIVRYRFIGRTFLDFSIMLPLALPGLILAFGYVGTFAGTVIDPRTNPFPLLIAAYSIRRLPFIVRSIDAGLRQMDPAVEEASYNLGASHTRTLTRITLPLVSANVLAGAILVFAFAMLEVSDSLILAMKENFYPITKAIYALVSRITDGFPLASALGVFTMILLGVSMIAAGRILGRKMGELFRM